MVLLGIKDNVNGLLDQYKKTSEQELRDKLVHLHEGLVRYLASRFTSSGEPFEDLFQEGIIGLIKAIDDFDSNRDTRFATYARFRIISEIRHYIRDKKPGLKIPRSILDLSYVVNQTFEKLCHSLGRRPTTWEIAEEVEIDEEEVARAKELSDAFNPLSLEKKMAYEENSLPLTLSDFVGDVDPNLEGLYNSEEINWAVDCLEPLERAIIHCRFYEDMSQTEISKRLNITQIRVSRTLRQVMPKLKNILKEGGVFYPLEYEVVNKN